MMTIDVPLVVVLAGVSGSGKSTVGEEVARRLGWVFQEGDLMHDVINIEKMRRGEPLGDADRQPWLLRVAEWIHAQLDAGRSGVITCSALKRSYRELLRQGRCDVLVAVLYAAEEVIELRMAKRRGHFMPTRLLPSQYADFEMPRADEDATLIDAAQPVAHNVIKVIEAAVERSHELRGDMH